MHTFFHSLLKTKRGQLWKVLLALVLLALVFQLVHFGEHIAQVVAWLSGYRNAPYMTALGHFLMSALGTSFYPDAPVARQMMMGNEILHLIGNSVYALGTVGILFFLRTKLTIAAAIIELFHLYEHMCLTLSAAIVGIPIGMSTLWGLPLEHAASVTLRVWWHFAFNAVPTVLSIVALYLLYKAHQSLR